VDAVLEVLDADEFIIRFVDRMNAIDGERRRQRSRTTTHLFH
jgi:hypothetical protein